MQVLARRFRGRFLNDTRVADRAQFRAAVVLFEGTRNCLAALAFVSNLPLNGSRYFRGRLGNRWWCPRASKRARANKSREASRQGCCPAFRFKMRPHRRVDVGARWYLDATRSRPLGCAKFLTGICVGECLDPSGNLPRAIWRSVLLALDTNARAGNRLRMRTWIYAGGCARDTLRDVRDRASINLLRILTLSS